MDKEQDWLEDPFFTVTELRGIADIVEGTLDSLSDFDDVEFENVMYWTNILRKCGREQAADEWEKAFKEDND